MSLLLKSESSTYLNSAFLMRSNKQLATLVFAATIIVAGFYSAHATWSLIDIEQDQLLELNTKIIRPADEEIPVSNNGRDKIPVGKVVASLKQFNPWGALAPKIAEKPKTQPKKKEVAVISKLDLILLGTFLTSDFHSTAILQRKKGKKDQIVMHIGDEFNGAFLEKIERNTVYFRNGNRLEKIVSSFKKSRKINKSTTKRIKATQYTLTRTNLKKVAAQAMFMLGSGEIKTSRFFRGVTPVGLQIQTTKKNELMEKYGLEHGDVVTSVNGVPAMETAKLLGMAKDLGTLSKIEIQFLRNGNPDAMSIAIR